MATTLPRVTTKRKKTATATNTAEEGQPRESLVMGTSTAIVEGWRWGMAVWDLDLCLHLLLLLVQDRAGAGKGRVEGEAYSTAMSISHHNSTWPFDKRCCTTSPQVSERAWCVGLLDRLAISAGGGSSAQKAASQHPPPLQPPRQRQ